MARVHAVGDDIDTDRIIPAKHVTSADPADLAPHCLAGLDESFAGSFRPGDVLVAGTNFGCGSSREHAAIAVKGLHPTAVIAESFARIFFRNAINIGLPVLQVPAATDHVATGDEVAVDLQKGTMTNRATGTTLEAATYPAFVREIIDAGGLIAYGRRLRRGEVEEP